MMRQRTLISFKYADGVEFSHALKIQRKLDISRKRQPAFDSIKPSGTRSSIG